MNDLDLLRSWPTEGLHPSAEVRAHALAQLEDQYAGHPVTPPPRAAAGRRFGKRLAIAALTAVVLLAGTIIWAQREVDDRLDQIKTVTVPPDALGGGEIGKNPVNVLVVGSDQRDGTNIAAFGSPAETGPPRSDTMILLHIDGTSVRGMWLPRDLLVGPAPGVKINSTFNHGPAGLITAIKGLGVTIDHYIEVGFSGFPRIVDALGGVRVFSPGPARDQYSGLDLPAGGCVGLNGMQALQWVRSRHLQVFDNGVWRDASPRADLDRQARQQDFLRAVARKAKAEVGDDPAAAVRLVDAIIPSLTIDSAFSRAEILGLVRVLSRVNPDDLALATVPVRSGADGASLVLSQPEADQALAPFRGEAPSSAAPSGQAVGPSAGPAPAC